MAAEKLQEYIDSVDELQKAYSKVQKYSELIEEVAYWLKKSPYKMTVSGVQVSFVVTGDREYSLSGNDWPSAKQLAEVLSDYVAKREKVMRLYSSLSDAQRSSVKPPPEI